jgi:hypothetical protein
MLLVSYHRLEVLGVFGKGSWIGLAGLHDVTRNESDCTFTHAKATTLGWSCFLNRLLEFEMLDVGSV